VLFICSQPFFEWRGSPIRVGFDLMSLVKAGHSVHFLSLPHGAEREMEGVTIERCFKLPGVKKVPIGPSLPKLIYDAFHFFMGLGVLLKNRSIHTIHAVEDSGIPAVVLAKVFGKKLVFEKHSDPSSHEKKGAFLRNLLLWAYERVESFVISQADAVIGTGDELVNQAKSVKADINAFSIPDIPSSLAIADEGDVGRIRKAIAPQGEVVATYVGSFAVYQGIDLMFDALPQALAACEQLRILIIGGTEQQIAARQETLDQLGFKSRVVFEGFVDPDALPAYLRASDILFSPRISGRNSPLKVLDYLKAGRAILATDNEANRQILDEKTAAFVSPNAESFACGLIKLVQDAQLREKLGTQGETLLNTRYNYGYFSESIARCYRSVQSVGDAEA
jgi:glycosyltransferase involved in cell wall biosynthesis